MNHLNSREIDKNFTPWFITFNKPTGDFFMKKCLILSSLFAFNAFALTIIDARKIEISVLGKKGTEKQLALKCADELGISLMNKSFNSNFNILNSSLQESTYYGDPAPSDLKYSGIGENGEKQISSKFFVNNAVFRNEENIVTVKCKLSSKILAEHSYLDVDNLGLFPINECTKKTYVRYNEIYPLADIFSLQNISHTKCRRFVPVECN